MKKLDGVFITGILIIDIKKMKASFLFYLQREL